MALTSTPANAPSLAAMAGGTVNTQVMGGGPNPNAVVGGVVDRRPWRYWDTFTWPTASPTVPLPNNIALFTVPMQQIDAYVPTLRKTKLQTNMTKSGEFPSPECLLMQQLSIYLCQDFGNTKVNIDQFFEGCWLEFKINNKIFWEGLPWMFPAGLGYMGTPAVANTADQNWTNGFPAPQAAWRAGTFSKYIAPLQPFSLNFFFPTPPTMATPFKLVVFLDGLADTAVQ
jgi:hypothetical protein